ncbi:exodeoxyribonuclease V subunit gamma [Orrella sp. 11846]|uniref:exodeoxyribonuclease V subunit gamma n=1 Tax=Orrella sp. 11846 TaxID=3409913 RepID=UPI003B59C138
MSEVRSVNAIEPGFMMLHSNRMESLCELVAMMMQRFALDPLEEEIILTQSRGMSEWLKTQLSADDRLGVVAGLRSLLPSSFLWQCYRTVLGTEAVTSSPLLSRQVLRWRLMKRLPTLRDDARFVPLFQYLADDENQRKLFQLSCLIADIYDQYQIYRSDWLADWAQGRDVLQGLDDAGMTEVRAQSLAWQAPLWRMLIEPENPSSSSSSSSLSSASSSSSLISSSPEQHTLRDRGQIHRRFIETLASFKTRPRGLPRRVIVFGLSSLPAQTLQALEALSPFMQIVLCVHNPCQMYWGDVRQYRLLHARHALKAGIHEQMSDIELHTEFQPLLAAWGEQGRDYMQLLSVYDDHERLTAYFESQPRSNMTAPLKTEVFDDEPADTLLSQLQNDILNLRSLDETRELWAPVDVSTDWSVRFHSAHSVQREVEVLHDQLLYRFSQNPHWTPADVVVMVPNIDRYAPHIEAVFGQYEPGDPKYLPFMLTDLGSRGYDPLLLALEQLLELPTCRLSFGEILLLLDVPEIRERFGIADADVARLTHWSQEAGARWGLNAEHRESFGLPPDLEANTWEFALKRMLSGYMLGSPHIWEETSAYGEVAGLEAPCAGALFMLLETLDDFRLAMVEDRSPQAWGESFRELLEAFFAMTQTPAALAMKRRIDSSLQAWLDECELAQLEDAIPLEVARQAWLEKLDDDREGRGFLSGKINFCTLLPMRSIPFKMVCLLGMNDGDFPRTDAPVDFDLLPAIRVPGDRSRRDDDRYLFLEAILSAREQLYISWVGRSMKDNTDRTPSVLVGQLMDHLNQGWQAMAEGALADDGLVDGSLTDGASGSGKICDQLVTQHWLQPFAPIYFDARHPDLFTYAHEWLPVHNDGCDEVMGSQASLSLPFEAMSAEVQCDELVRFLKVPINIFFKARYKASLSDQGIDLMDVEPFAMDFLQKYRLWDAFSQAARTVSEDELPKVFTEVSRQWRLSGELALCGFDQLQIETVVSDFQKALENFFPTRTALVRGQAPALTVQAQYEGITFNDRIDHLFVNEAGDYLALHLVNGDLWKSSHWRSSAMLKPWVEHIVVCASGYACTSYLFGADYSVRVLPVEPQEAQAQLQTWLKYYQQALTRPLPVTAKTGIALHYPYKAGPKTRRSSEAFGTGGRYGRGESNYEILLTRVYPSFEAMLETGEFEELAQALFGLLKTYMPPPPRRTAKAPKVWELK